MIFVVVVAVVYKVKGKNSLFTYKNNKSESQSLRNRIS